MTTPARQPQQIEIFNKWRDKAVHEKYKPNNSMAQYWDGYETALRNVIDYIATHTSAQAPEPDEIRPEVIAFAKVMEDTLRKHDGKKTHWRDVSVSFGYLFGRVSDEIREAKDEYHVHNPDYHKCVMELVDVANFCMMCYDRIHPADTRSRPHTSAPAPGPSKCQICVLTAGSCLSQHDAQVAKAAREDVLKELTEKFSELRHEGWNLWKGQEAIDEILGKRPNPCEENGCTDIENCDEICQHSRLFSPLQMQEAKEQAAKAAREQVLDAIINWKRKNCFWIRVDTITGQKRYHFDPDRFEEFIDILRSQQEPQQ
jgi:hypothetical protein